MLAAYQIINKVLQTKDYSIIKRNGLEAKQFSIYSEQFQFIVDHYKKNGNIPDMLTFQSYFPDFTFNEVYETDDYLLDRLYEENGYQKWSEILPTLNQKIKEDSRLAYDYMKEQMQQTLKPHTVCKGYDIIANAMERYQKYIDRSKLEVSATISTGFPELDDVFGGWEYGEELVTIVARTNAGKSWLLLKFLAEAWKQGKRVGLYSGEMSELKLGYRFDAIFGHFSNKALVRGTDVEGYLDYINNLSGLPGCFIIVTQEQFGGRPTVQQLRNFIEENQLDILGIDQLSLMSDGRASRNDPPRMRLSHIAEDLFLLSSEYKIPILALAQANRDAVNKENQDAPGLENIKESDDIAHNSSKCIGMRQWNGHMIMDIIKNREGRVGDKLMYAWQIDSGYFEYVPTGSDAVSEPLKKDIAVQRKTEVTNNFSVNPF